MNIADLRILIAPLQRRVAAMVSRAIVTLVFDAKTRQTLQLTALAGGLLDPIERFQQYGFTSVPFPGAEAIVVFPAGNRDHGIALSVEDRRYRLVGLAAGEAALYDDLGQVVHLTRTGIKITSPLDITVSAGQKLRLEGDVVEVVAHTTLRHDIAGYADELTHTGGVTWSQDTWQTGAVVTATPHAVDPPEHF
jgi:phage baseplate assembly protein V